MANNFRAEVETIAILIIFQLVVPRLIRIYSQSVDKAAEYFYPNDPYEGGKANKNTVVQSLPPSDHNGFSQELISRGSNILVSMDDSSGSSTGSF